MSNLLDVLNKLASKYVLDGGQEYAYKLISASDLINKCKYCKEKDVAKGKSACSTCGKSTACSLDGCSTKKAYGEMKKYANKPFCCSDCIKKYKDLVGGFEKTSLKDNLKNKDKENNMKKNSSILNKMIKKYAQADYQYHENDDDDEMFNIHGEGYDAAKENGDNPYAPNTPEYRAWTRGYEYALENSPQDVGDYKGDIFEKSF